VPTLPSPKGLGFLVGRGRQLSPALQVALPQRGGVREG